MPLDDEVKPDVSMDLTMELCYMAYEAGTILTVLNPLLLDFFYLRYEISLAGCKIYFTYYHVWVYIQDGKQSYICRATTRRPPFPVNYVSWFPSELRGKAVPSIESPYPS